MKRNDNPKVMVEFNLWGGFIDLIVVQKSRYLTISKMQIPV